MYCSKKMNFSTRFAECRDDGGEGRHDAKLQFTLSVADDLQHFLTFFQTDRPCLPFLYQEMVYIIQNISNRFLSKTVWNKKNINKFALEIKNIKIGTGAKIAIKNLPLVEQLGFKESCKKFLNDLLIKLLEKFPLANKTIKGASCLSPKVVLSTNAELRESRVEMILEEFAENNIFTASEADFIKRSYLKMSETTFLQDVFKTFNENEDRLDHFYVRLQKQFPNVFDCKLQKFIQTICIMFHGNAAVERGFSVNGDILVENLQEDSLIGQRRIYDYMKTIDFNLENLDINNEMMRSFRLASKKRKGELKRKQDEKSVVEITRKRTIEEIKVLELKKVKLMKEEKEKLENLDDTIKMLKRKL